jgi:hypothetical protein
MQFCQDKKGAKFKNFQKYLYKNKLLMYYKKGCKYLQPPIHILK